MFIAIAVIGLLIVSGLAVYHILAAQRIKRLRSSGKVVSIVELMAWTNKRVTRIYVSWIRSGEVWVSTTDADDSQDGDGLAQGFLILPSPSKAEVREIQRKYDCDIFLPLSGSGTPFYLPYKPGEQKLPPKSVKGRKRL